MASGFEQRAMLPIVVVAVLMLALGLVSYLRARQIEGRNGASRRDARRPRPDAATRDLAALR